MLVSFVKNEIYNHTLKINCKVKILLTFKSSDRTYNLGKFWVTTTAFQVPWLEVKRKRDKKKNWPPIIPGPLFIHYEATTITYASIFAQLNQLLRTEKAPLNIRFAITTDGELAMVKGCKLSMVNSIHSLCHRHLRGNAKRQMKGSMKDEQVEILGQIFDRDDALVNLEEENQFREAAANINRNCFKTETFLDEMIEKIWHSVILPRKQANGTIKVRNNTNSVGKQY